MNLVHSAFGVDEEISNACAPRGGMTRTSSNAVLGKRGFAARIFRPLFRLISASWQMAFLGFLFGFGFDNGNRKSR